MIYKSTRGKSRELNFEEVLLTGLADDGGLYMPDTFPFYQPEEILSWRNLSYEELAHKVMFPFVEGSFSEDDFRAIIKKSYQSFRHDAIAPLSQLSRNEWILELYHGPTLAFKDFALQLLGNLLDHVLAKRNERIVIMGATSGDTGSAAIEGCRNCDNIDIFILHPHNKVSDVQRKQMTSVLADNIHNIAIKGNFDDCQELVKASFRGQTFLKGRKLVAVNSINWARIMAQIVYYFYAALNLGAPAREVSFSVPTGNFGDILAGYIARKMGLPIKKLIIATNSNDILHRTLVSGKHEKHTLLHTLSPSMDIMVSSNFERLLYDLYGQDAETIHDLMHKFKEDGSFDIAPHIVEKLNALFTSSAVNDEETCETIKNVFNRSEITIDPHTAIGVKAARDTIKNDNNIPVITLSTAHPAKFAEAVIKAGLAEATLPPHLADLMEREERFEVLEHDLSLLHKYVAEKSNINSDAAA